jgi:hypothetical protein
MKLYCYHTSAYLDILHEFFLPSLQDDFEVTLWEGSFQGDIVKFGQTHWSDITREKVVFIIAAIRDNWKRQFVFADPDIQFFRRTEELLTRYSQGQDIVWQRANPWGDVCTGYFVCHANDRTLRLWEDAHELMGIESTEDQTAANTLLTTQSVLARLFGPFPRAINARAQDFMSRQGSNRYGLRWRFLPPTKFFLAGARSGRVWSPGSTFRIPDDICMHHASWVIGKEDKIAQLRYVRNIVQMRARQ